jgi:ubiquinone/menaquinone biosynthesis C-methylase UbiE
VLDVGCGTGNLSLKFLMLGSEVTALDISQEMLNVLQSKVPKTLRRKIHFVCQDIDEFLSREKSYYDVICFSSVLHHLPDYLATIGLAISRLNPRGIIYIAHEPLLPERILQNKVIEAVDGYLDYLLRIRRKRTMLPILDYSMTDVHSREGIHLKKLIALLKRKNMDIVMIDEYATHKTWIFAILAELLREKTSFRLIARKR